MWRGRGWGDWQSREGGWCGVPVKLFLLWCMLSSASTPMHEKHTSQPTINKDSRPKPVKYRLSNVCGHKGGGAQEDFHHDDA